MASLLKAWCNVEDVDLTDRYKLHILRERTDIRSSLEKQIDGTVASHYEDPRILSERLARVGMPRAAKVLREMLPRTKRARSGHIGEVFATEAVPAFLRSFEIPIKRLRWLDGREAALRGEDLIGVEQNRQGVRFLKGESKSRANLTESVVAEAREMLAANNGRPSQHALSYVMHRLIELGKDQLALIFEEYLVAKRLAATQIVHLLCTLSGNDASNALLADLKACKTRIEQHSIALRIPDHQDFIASVYKRLEKYAP